MCGVETIKIVSTIASKQGLQEVCAENPSVEIFLSVIDDGLSEFEHRASKDEGYILSGLSGVDDREFQTGAQLENIESVHNKQK
ncbi:hypothetical protein PRNP1_001411 [Phytophthora ramorum]